MNEVVLQNDMMFDITLIENHETLLASADVTIPTEVGDITVRGFKVLKGDRGDWVAFPRTMSMKDGEKQYYDVLEISKRVKKEISGIILHEYKKIQKNAG